MSKTGTKNHRSEFFKRFEAGERVDAALRTPDNANPLFFFHDSQDPDLRSCALVIGRLGREIENQFGLASEVIILFSPFEDLQRRSFNALTANARSELAKRQIEVSASVRFTPDRDIAFIVSPDDRATEKIREWNSTEATSFAIPIVLAGMGRTEIRQAIITEIAIVLEERDLYRGRNPVTGNAFFGRNDLLQKIASGVRDGRSLGLFGLRRSGKTSVLREYQLRRRGASEIVVLSDLESIAGLDEVAQQIGEDLNQALRLRRASDSSVFIGGEDTHSVNNSSDLARRIKLVAGRNPNLRLVFALDEIESLKPFADSYPDRTRSFLGALRQAAQTTENVTLLFTGITTRFFSQSTLSDGIDNPLFGFVDPIHLRPFELAESTNLITSLGKKMLLKWDADAAHAVHEVAGGFPFLVRDLASRVRQSITSQRDNPLALLPVSIGNVEAVRSQWAEESATLWTEIVRSLEAHHPIMAALLVATPEEIADWQDAGEEAVSDARTLEKLGLLRREGAAYIPTDALEALQQLGPKATVSADEVRERLSATADLMDLIALGESRTLEFKSTARFNLRTKQPDKELGTTVVKTVGGFLNAHGGILIIGVDDRGQILGLSRDLKLFKDSIDSFQNWIQASLLSQCLSADVVAESVRVSFQTIQGKQVCTIEVSRSHRPVWTDIAGPGTFHVRMGNATKQLHGAEQYEYINAHWID